MSRLGLVVVVVAVLAVGIGAAAALRLGDDTPSTSHAGGGGAQLKGTSLLHEARLDAANKSGVDAKDVKLISIRGAGFDGCLGVYLPDSACTMQLFGGYIAVFEANGKEWRYHFGGDNWVATEPQPAGARIDDGVELDAMLMPDFVAILADYARHDVALQDDVDPADAVVERLVPNICASTDNCTVPDSSQAYVVVRAKNELRYLVTPDPAVALDDVQYPVARVDDAPQWAVPSNAAELQEKLRADLAGRLNVAESEISASQLRRVTWSDGCLGVSESGKVCTQALVPGWLAAFTVDGEEYSFHGAGEVNPTAHYVAASFVANATLYPPMPAE